METVLIIDDDRNMRLVLAAMVEREGFRALTAEDGTHGVRAFREQRPDIVITDLRMPGLDGLGVLREVQREDREIPVILLTAHGTIEAAVAALKQGAFDFMTKPFDDRELANVLLKARATRERASRDARSPAGGEQEKLIIGRDPKILKLYETIKKIAKSPSTVLVTGESGTGKELVAREIHRHGDRSDKPFIKINCAAIPENLLESELFGYERGAFTGAVTSKPGRFELADGGTLFLDEISTLNLDMQVKLLQVLQDGCFERVGGIKTIRIDIRLVAATNLRLQDEMEAGRFREDLFYRLNVVPIRIPPLRERKGDIPLLARHFLEAYNRKLDREIKGFGPETSGVLNGYDWPGNIRELENAVERAVLLCEGERIEASDLPEEVIRIGGPAPQATSGEPSTMKDTVKEATRAVEREMIARALEETGGNVTRAAERLEISRKGLQLKMKELGFRGRDTDGTP